MFNALQLQYVINKKGIPTNYQILGTKTLFAKAITEQDQILCLMACIPAHGRVAGCIFWGRDASVAARLTLPR